MKDWPSEAGEMAGRIRTHDWNSTPLGPVATWPAALRRAAEITLGAPMASVLLWGPEYIVVAYNEGYRVILGDKPDVFGQPVLEVWAEERALLEPQLARVLNGETLLFRELPMSLSRGAVSDESWFDYGYGPVRDDSGAVAGLIVSILEVTDRVLAQRALRESEKRQTFLLKLSDTLRPLADPLDIMAAASEALGRHLAVGRCGYAEMDETGDYFIVERDWTDGVMPSYVGRHFFGFGDQFREAYRAGKSVLIDDALVDARAAGNEVAFEAAGGVRAALGLPLIKEGRFVAGFFVQQVEPRHWTAEDEALTLAVAERTWAAVERARAESALRESEERLHLALASANLGTFVWHVAEDRTEEDARARAHFGLPPDGTVSLAEALAKIFHPEDGPRYAAAVARAVDPAGPGTLHEEYRIRHPSGEERWMSTSAITAFEGTPRAAARLTGVLADVTERKRAEAALRESEERQAFLLKLSDALRPFADPLAIESEACRLLGERLGVNRVYYAEISEVLGKTRIVYDHVSDGPPSLVGEYRLADFPWALPPYRKGETIILPDIAHAKNMSAAERVAVTSLGMASMITVPLLKQGQLLGALAAADRAPRAWRPSDVRLVEETCERIWAAVERARAEAALRESEARFTQFANASSGGLWIRDAATLAMEYVSPAMDTIYGVEPDAMLGEVEKWAAMIVPEDRDAALQHLESARRGESVSHEFRIRRPSDGTFWWIRDTGFPLRSNNNGHVQRIGGIAEDVTEEKLNAEHQGVLLAELQHRVRNIMAIIRSIVTRTARGADDVEHYSELLSGRLLTLARVQALLTRAANAGVDIVTIVHDELTAQATHAGQFDASGPEVKLSAKAAETMTLAVHELTTNALKHGALSLPEGKVTVRWSVEEKGGTPWLTFDWNETGAPARPMSPGPRRVGFGSELIEGRIPYELRGRGKVTIDSGGAQCHLEFPLQAGASVLETDAPRRVDVFGGAIDMTGAADLSGQRILVVEDDYYLAHDTARALKAAGAEVVGPCPSEDSARDAMSHGPLTGAVLDINLNGGRSFELARELSSQGVPFVFVTGYDREVIPTEFEGVSRLQKPVEFRRIVNTLADSLLMEREGKFAMS